MPVLDYFVNNFVMLFELVGLFIILFISAHVSKQVKLYTRITILLLFISMLVTATENWLASRDTYTVWRPILTSFKYTFSYFNGFSIYGTYSTKVVFASANTCCSGTSYLLIQSMDRISF